MNKSNLFNRRKALTAIGTAGITFVSAIQSGAANPLAAKFLGKKKKFSSILFYENVE